MQIFAGISFCHGDKPKAVLRRRVAERRWWQWRSIETGNPSRPLRRAKQSIMISDGTCDVMEIYLAAEANSRRLRDESPEISALRVKIVGL